MTVGVSAALRQLLEFGLFHGDPHPGNIFAMRDGRIAYVDFGNVAVLSQVICVFAEILSWTVHFLPLFLVVFVAAFNNNTSSSHPMNMNDPAAIKGNGLGILYGQLSI